MIFRQEQRRTYLIVCSQYNLFLYSSGLQYQSADVFVRCTDIQTGCSQTEQTHTADPSLPEDHRQNNHCVFELVLFEHNQTSTCVARPISGRVTLLVSTAGPENRFQDGTADHLEYFPERLDQIPRGLSWCRLRSQMSPSCSGWHVIGQTAADNSSALESRRGSFSDCQQRFDRCWISRQTLGREANINTLKTNRAQTIDWLDESWNLQMNLSLMNHQNSPVRVTSQTIPTLLPAYGWHNQKTTRWSD